MLQKVAIYKNKKKLCLDLSDSFDEQSLSSHHSCEKSSYFVNREAPVDLFQNLPELKQALSKEVKMVLVYIAGVYLENAQLQMIHIFILPNMELTSKN